MFDRDDFDRRFSLIWNTSIFLVILAIVLTLAGIAGGWFVIVRILQFFGVL